MESRPSARAKGGAVRAFVLWTHRWLGIASCVFLVLIGLTGAMLVYERPMDALLNRRLYRVPVRETRLAYDSLVAIAARARPRQGPATVVHMPRRAGESARVEFSYHQVFMDPATGEILGERGIGEAAMHRVRVLHHSLLNDTYGRTFTVIATALSLVLAIGGVVLWWPRKIFLARRRKNLRRLLFDLHNVVGIFGALGTIVFAATALAMQFGDVLEPVYHRAFGYQPDVRLAAASSRTARPKSIDEVVAIGDTAVAGALWDVQLPADAHGTYVLSKQAPGEHGNRARNRVYVDGNDGRIRGIIDQNARPFGSRISMLMEDWHIAAFAPDWSRWFGIVSCLLLAAASATGPLLWWRPQKRS